MAQKFVRSVDNIQDISKVKMAYHDENDLLQDTRGYVYIVVDKGQGKELAKIYPQENFIPFQAKLEQKTDTDYSLTISYMFDKNITMTEMRSFFETKLLEKSILIDFKYSGSFKEIHQFETILSNENVTLIDEPVKCIKLGFSFSYDFDNSTNKQPLSYSNFITINIDDMYFSNINLQSSMFS